jgi:hypothetical protein
MTETKKNKNIVDNPVVIYPGTEIEDIPVDIRQEIQRQRMIQIEKNEFGEATDAEVLAYIYSSLQVRPIPKVGWRIQSYLHAKTFGGECYQLSEEDKTFLTDLKRKIWNDANKEGD